MATASVTAIRTPLLDLLTWREALAGDLLAGRGMAARSAALTAVLVAGSALYGVALGSWHGARLSEYCAVKLPLVLLLTTAVTVVFSWIAGNLLRVPLALAQVVSLNLFVLAFAAALLASLVPVVLLFSLTAPPPTEAARTTHNLLYLMHTGFIAACGVMGMRALWSLLLRTRQPRGRLRAVFTVWIVTYALVGGEVAWALRPFVGSVSPDYPLVFIRADALHGNVYEFIWTDILPHLARALLN